MRLSMIITSIVLSANLLLGQDKPANTAEEAFEAVIIPVKTLSGDSFNRLTKLLGVFNARFTADDKLRTIVVYAPKNVVTQMRRVIEELDRPGSDAAIGRNIEMTLAFLRCSTKAPSEAHPLPADLEAVARQLRAATQYKSVELWDIVPLRLQEGKNTEETLRLPNPATGGGVATASLHIDTEAVGRKDSGRYVRFGQIRIGFRVPYSATFEAGGQPNPQVQTQWSYADVGLTTAGDFMEAQKTVLGKVSGIDEGTAIFVVISLKVLD